MIPKKIALLLIIVFLFSGCAAHTSRVEEVHIPSSPPVAAPAAPETAGSLWTDRRGSLFYDNKASNVGDIVTVAIYEKASASKEASTSTGRNSSVSAGIDALFGLEDNIAKINKSINPSSLVSASYENDFEGTGTTKRKEDLVATLTTRVIEVLPNGNLRINGGKTVAVNNENQIIRLSGIVRQEDISPQNYVDSKHVLDANIEYTGKGVISDKQKPGWLVRLLDNAWPF